MPTRRAVLALPLAGTLAALAACGPAEPAGAGSSTGDGTVLTPFPYGDDAVQVADLLEPPGDAPAGGRPVVVLVHGGYWSADYDRSLEDAVAADLVAAGYAVWNVDYRSVGNGGGYPQTFADVAAACDALAGAAADRGLDLDRVAVAGHSAGGTLALWAAARHRLPSGTTGADPVLRPVGVVTQAGINDLVTGADDGLGGGAVEALLGVAPSSDPDGVYDVTSPTALLPLGVPTLVVTGGDDTTVPVSQSREYAAAAQAAGDEAQLEVVDGEGHFEFLDPSSRVWAVTRSWLDERLRP